MNNIIGMGIMADTRGSHLVYNCRFYGRGIVADTKGSHLVYKCWFICDQEAIKAIQHLQSSSVFSDNHEIKDAF